MSESVYKVRQEAAREIMRSILDDMLDRLCASDAEVQEVLTAQQTLINYTWLRAIDEEGN